MAAVTHALHLAALLVNIIKVWCDFTSSATLHIASPGSRCYPIKQMQDITIVLLSLIPV